jgi:hypothetical protein
MSALSRAVVAAATLALALATPAIAADDAHADLCLELDAGAVTEAEWEKLEVAVSDVIATSSALFPAPTVSASALRLDVASGHAELPVAAGAPCLEPGYAWTARFGSHFLGSGAERMLAEAPTTPGIESNVIIEWHPDEARLRTQLHFAGPFDIPNGTCWVDDTLSVETETGTVLASGEQGQKTSLLAGSACGRFFDHLPDGGAGEQVATLLPRSIGLPDGSSLHFAAEDVSVSDAAITIAGSLSRD